MLFREEAAVGAGEDGGEFGAGAGAEFGAGVGEGLRGEGDLFHARDVGEEFDDFVGRLRGER